MRERALCARFHKAIELIGRRWSGAIIQVLLAGPSRFAEMRASIPGITDRMLSERLRELETEGLVRRRVTVGVPVRVEYELSIKGRDLQRAIAAISSWARQWMPGPGRGSPSRGHGAPGFTSAGSRRRHAIAMRSTIPRD